MVTPERYRKLTATLARRQPDLTVLLDGVHKAWNLSAVVRTADACGLFEVHAVLLPDDDEEEFFLSKAHASGSHKWVGLVPHRSTQAAIADLKAKGFAVVGADLNQQAIDFRAFDFTQPTAVVMGAEKFGLTEAARHQLDSFLSIPMLGFCGSLNVSVATALILYEAQRQRAEAGLYESCRLSPEQFRRTLFEWAYPEATIYCQKKGLSYPSLNDQGEIQGLIDGLSLTQVRAIIRGKLPQQEAAEPSLSQKG